VHRPQVKVGAGRSLPALSAVQGCPEPCRATAKAGRHMTDLSTGCSGPYLTVARVMIQSFPTFFRSNRH
jgi:hypothetical protein